jgi:hypothetical protein
MTAIQNKISHFFLEKDKNKPVEIVISRTFSLTKADISVNAHGKLHTWSS